MRIKRIVDIGDLSAIGCPHDGVGDADELAGDELVMGDADELGLVGEPGGGCIDTHVCGKAVVNGGAAGMALGALVGGLVGVGLGVGGTLLVQHFAGPKR